MARSLFTCAACLRRASLATSRPHALPEPSRFVRMFVLGHARRRHLTTDAEIRASRSLASKPAEASMAKKKDLERLERSAKRQLQQNSDPWHVAKQVEHALEKGRYDEALLLTKTASRSTQVPVSWNHLIDYKMKNQQLREAVKLYNDMKKRAQLPNLRTYTIIFRGCARSKHVGQAVDVAVKHYNILLKDQRLQPNTIHLNAVLNVCAKGYDLESMFVVAGTVNESTRAPTAVTFTTILHSLHAHALRDRSTDLTPEQLELSNNRYIERAKGLWMEVIEKWRRGKLIIDETLICAMGRVLLLDRARHAGQDTLKLLQQTMRIPRMDMPSVQETNGDEETKQSTEMCEIKPSSTSGTTYARPGNNTFALIMHALSRKSSAETALKYWDLMINEYGLVPDRDIWLRMLGLLKTSGSGGAHVGKLLNELPEEYVEPTPFRIAMGACLNDSVDPGALLYGTQVLECMKRRLDTPDLRTLRIYMRLAHSTKATTSARDGTSEEKYGEQIMNAIEQVWEPYDALYQKYFRGEEPADEKDRRIRYSDQGEVVALARTLYSALAKVLERNMLPEKKLRGLRPMAGCINRRIRAFFAGREEREPNLPTAVEKRRQRQDRIEMRTARAQSLLE